MLLKKRLDDEVLIHHGVKGQQWGIQHGPPYPVQKGSGVTIKMGAKFSRLSQFDETTAKGHAYVTYLQSDKEHYKGFFGIVLKRRDPTKAVYQHTLIAKRDLKSPDMATRKQTFEELYKNDPKITKELANYYRSNHIKFLPNFIYEKRYKNLEGKDLENKGFKTMVRGIGGNDYLREQYFNALAKKGYDFVMDDMDGQYMLKYGKEPAIIFDREKSVDYNGKLEVGLKEITKNLKAGPIHVKG